MNYDDIPWVYVTSSNLYTVKFIVPSMNIPGYDINTLIITFHSGHRYEYYGVPRFVFQALLNASSKGKFHHAAIKYKYPYSKET